MSITNGLRMWRREKGHRASPKHAPGLRGWLTNRLLGNALYRLLVQAAAVEEDGERIAFERAFGKDIHDSVTVVDRWVISGGGRRPLSQYGRRTTLRSHESGARPARTDGIPLFSPG